MSPELEATIKSMGFKQDDFGVMKRSLGKLVQTVTYHPKHGIVLRTIAYLEFTFKLTETNYDEMMQAGMTSMRECLRGYDDKM